MKERIKSNFVELVGMCYNGKGWGTVFINFEMKSSLKDLNEDEKIEFCHSFKQKFGGD